MAGIELTNSLDVVELKMDVPTLDDTMPDNERLTRALQKYMNLKRVRIPYAVLKKLPDVLRESKFSVKCVVRTAPNDMYVYDILTVKRCCDRWSCCRYRYYNSFCSSDQYGNRRDPGEEFFR